MMIDVMIMCIGIWYKVIFDDGIDLMILFMCDV